MNMKCCATCGESKPVIDFYRRKETADGYQSKCKACHQERRRELMQDPDRRAAYEASHRKASREYARRWRREHYDDPAARDYKRAFDRERYHRDLTASRAQRRADYAANPEPRKAMSRHWLQAHPDASRRHFAIRKAQVYGSAGRYSAQEWRDLCEQYGNQCLRCGASSQLSADHIVPLSKGGGNDIGNIQPLCLSCNSSKAGREADYRPSHAGHKGRGQLSLDENFIGWAVVKLVGGETIVGRAQEARSGRSRCLRIDLCADGDAPARTLYQSPGSIYSISPCTEDVARIVARSRRPPEISAWDLPPELRRLLTEPRADYEPRAEDDEVEPESEADWLARRERLSPVPDPTDLPFE